MFWSRNILLSLPREYMTPVRKTLEVLAMPVKQRLLKETTHVYEWTHPSYLHLLPFSWRFLIEILIVACIQFCYIFGTGRRIITLIIGSWIILVMEGLWPDYDTLPTLCVVREAAHGWLISNLSGTTLVSKISQTIYKRIIVSYNYLYLSRFTNVNFQTSVR